MRRLGLAAGIVLVLACGNAAATKVGCADLVVNGKSDGCVAVTVLGKAHGGVAAFAVLGCATKDNEETETITVKGCDGIVDRLGDPA